MYMNNRIAIFTSGFSNEFIQHVIGGIREKAKEDSMDIFTFVTYCTNIDSEFQNKCQLNMFHLPNPKDFDGAIMFTNTFSSTSEQEIICARFQKAGIPMISLEVEIPGMSLIKTDNYHGMYDLTEHLVTVHGVKKLIYINGFEGNVENAIRKQAVIDALGKYNLSLYDDLPGDFSFYGTYISFKNKLESGYDMPDAIVCANDNMALGICTLLAEKGYKVPNDVIVTGFDMIHEGRYTFPIIATVSKNLHTLGKATYSRLMYQIQHPDDIFVESFSSEFIPSESCGCQASQESIDYRFETIRSLYFSDIKRTILEIFFQRLQLAVSDSIQKEDFFNKGNSVLDEAPLLGSDYCICTEPSFFEDEDVNADGPSSRIRGYSRKMDVLFEKRNGISITPYIFSSKELYPGYSHKKGESNHYIFAPLNHNEYIIGYVAIKNDEELLFNQRLRTWIINMNAILFNMRRYIFANRNNIRLNEIYMTDALTGIYNRTGCENILYNYVKEQKANNKISILAFADIDRMKTINDVYGHLNGDLAIKATADAFQKFSPKGWIFGRYGGDEFIAVGTCDNPNSIDAEIKNIVNSMFDYFSTLNLSFKLHASIGYTIISPNEEGTIEDYIKRADESMYAEKERIHKIMDSTGI